MKKETITSLKRKIQSLEREIKTTPKIIDQMEVMFNGMGYKTKRGTWEDFDGKGRKERCNWLDVKLFDKKNNKYTVHFYFDGGGHVFNNITVYKAKPQKGWKIANTLCDKDGLKGVGVKFEQPNVENKVIGTVTGTTTTNCGAPR
jgi:hypothetical protein